jgi:hypothetical protein
MAPSKRPVKKRRPNRDVSKSSIIVKTTRLHSELLSSDEEEDEEDYRRGMKILIPKS